MLPILNRSFDRLDLEKRGLISIENFITTNNIVNTRFAKLTMSIYDEHGSGGKHSPSLHE